MIDPQAQDVIVELQAKGKPMPADESEWLKAYREELDAIVAMQGPAPAVDTSDLEVATDGARIGLRLYRPPESGLSESGKWPTLLFVHGGGFVAGSLKGYDTPVRWLALRSGWQIAAVDYRLAPEHPYPAAPDDCFAALRHLLADETAEVDRARVAVGGDSAGGLLATVVARRARDSGIPLVLQALIYPNADLREEATPHASRSAFDGVVIRINELYRSLDLYLMAADRSLPDISPLMARDLEGLGPTLLITNEYDPLRDEAEAYGARLREAGVQVDAQRLDGMIHSAMQRGARIDRGDALITRVADALRATTTLSGG